MRTVRPGVLSTLATGTGLSAIFAAGGLLASGMLHVPDPMSAIPGLGTPISLSDAPPPSARGEIVRSGAGDSALRAPTTTAPAVEAQLRAAVERAVRERLAGDPAAREGAGGARRPTGTITPGSAREQVAAVPSPSQPAQPAPAAATPVAPASDTPPVASAARRVTLRVASLDVQPATAAGNGTLRMRLAVDETTANADGAPAALPEDVEVVVGVPEMPPGKAIRVSVDLQHAPASADGTPAAEPTLRVLVSFVDAPSTTAAVSETAPSTDTASNTLDVIAPLDAPTHGAPAPGSVVVPPAESTGEIVPVEVRMPVGTVDSPAPGEQTVQVPVDAPGPAGAGDPVPVTVDVQPVAPDDPTPEPQPETPGKPEDVAPEAPSGPQEPQPEPEPEAPGHAPQPAAEEPAAEQPAPAPPAAPDGRNGDVKPPAPEAGPAPSQGAPAPEVPAPAPDAPVAAEAPAPETPAAEAPAPETPAAEAPAPETPAAEAPAPETPAAEAPAPEAPAAAAAPASEAPAEPAPAAPAAESPPAAEPAAEGSAAAEPGTPGGAEPTAPAAQGGPQDTGASPAPDTLP